LDQEHVYEATQCLLELTQCLLKFNTTSFGESLLDAYLERKAALLQSLLNQLPETNIEQVLSHIVLILQYNIILHPYHIFVAKTTSYDLPVIQLQQVSRHTLADHSDQSSGRPGNDCGHDRKRIGADSTVAVRQDRRCQVGRLG
jgi:hypothetical protein